MSDILRETGETRVRVSVEKGDGASRIETSDGFLDHMLVTLARYAGLALVVEAESDLRHHLVEDVAITLGLALAEEIPPHAARYGSALVPMDEALVEAAIDVGGRPYYVGRLPSNLYEHFLQSFAVNLGATLHVRVVRGRDRHHVVEAAVKATGLALRQALGEGHAVFSTKGSVRISRPADAGGSADAVGSADAGGAAGTAGTPTGGGTDATGGSSAGAGEGGSPAGPEGS